MTRNNIVGLSNKMFKKCCQNKVTIYLLSTYNFSMILFMLLFTSFHDYADCIYHIEQSSKNHFINYRFGVFEDQRKTTKLLKEELSITFNLQQVFGLITNKG